MKLGLGAIDALCERLGRPEWQIPAVLVAGTNGKGSVAATLSAIAAAGGVRAGLYTSPHLIRVGERIRVCESDLSDEELDSALQPVLRAAEAPPEIPVTYFEALTAAAFVAFAERALDLALLEVGLGGRFDATNVASPGMSPSSGGTRYGMIFSDLRVRSQLASSEAPDATPSQPRNSRLSIVSPFSSGSYRWQIVQSVGALFASWHEAHQPILSELTARTFAIAANWPWHCSHCTPAFTWRLCEK